MEIYVHEILPFSTFANMATMRIFDAIFDTFNLHRKSTYIIVIYTQLNAKIITVTYIERKIHTVSK
jgi:predicted RNA-binding protein with PIN domain